MKIFTILLSFLLACTVVKSQCIPDTSITHNDPGIYPDSATDLPHGTAGLPYSTVMQVKVQLDSLITDPVTGFQYTAHFDSIVMTGVSGLPAGFTYTCTPATCSFPGGSDACLTLSGNPTSAGVYPLVVHVSAYVTALTIPQVVPVDYTAYSLVIDPQVGFAGIENGSFSVGQNNPNPSKSIATFPVTLAHPEMLELKISNLIGKKVFSQNQFFQKGKSNFIVDVRNLQAGIYIYSISDGVHTFTKRMIVSDN